MSVNKELLGKEPLIRALAPGPLFREASKKAFREASGGYKELLLEPFPLGRTKSHENPPKSGPGAPPGRPGALKGLHRTLQGP